MSMIHVGICIAQDYPGHIAIRLLLGNLECVLRDPGIITSSRRAYLEVRYTYKSNNSEDTTQPLLSGMMQW